MPSSPTKKRFWLEGPIIVVSILLAFGIEAGWAGLVEAREAHRLLQLIRNDVVATQSIVAGERIRSQELSTRARVLLEVMATLRSEADVAAALGTLGSVFVTGGWSPVNHTYVEAVNSGRLRLIESEQLRLELTKYQSMMDNLSLLYESIETQYYAELEPFLVANTVYSEIAAEWWRDALVEAPCATDFAALSGSRELWNLLTLRLEAEVAVQDRLDRLADLINGLIPMLPAGN